MLLKLMGHHSVLGEDLSWTHGNQIHLVTLRPTVDTSFIFTKKSNVAKSFFDIFNAEIAQCRQKIDVILGTKVVQF